MATWKESANKVIDTLDELNVLVHDHGYVSLSQQIQQGLNELRELVDQIIEEE